MVGHCLINLLPFPVKLGSGISTDAFLRRTTCFAGSKLGRRRELFCIRNPLGDSGQLTGSSYLYSIFLCTIFLIKSVFFDLLYLAFLLKSGVGPLHEFGIIPMTLTTLLLGRFNK